MAATARSYFIDTILQDFPFPKIYLYQAFSSETNKPYKELVDGQQRITTIQDFYHNKFPLSNTSKKFKGLRFRDLDEETQKIFVSYQIEHSTILSATRTELLEMFRRMNAYTAPLKEAEKRHSTYQGAFKWFVASIAEGVYSPLLDAYDILTEKQIARMGDAEFVSDLVVVLESGIQSKRNTAIEKLYKDYDEIFPREGDYEDVLIDFFDVLIGPLAGIRGSFMTKSYVIHSLFCAYVAIKHGFPGSEAFVSNLILLMKLIMRQHCRDYSSWLKRTKTKKMRDHIVVTLKHAPQVPRSRPNEKLGPMFWQKLCWVKS